MTQDEALRTRIAYLASNERDAKPATFTTRTVSRTRVAIERNGKPLCYLRPNEVRSWLDRAQRAEAEEIVFQAERRAARLRNVRDYLARRKARPVQLKLI